MSTMIRTIAAVLAIGLAIAPAATAAGDVRSPDTRDAAERLLPAGDDLRSPDTLDAAELLRAGEPAAVQTIVTRSGNFDWGDAGIGAAAALGLVALSAGALQTCGRERRSAQVGSGAVRRALRTGVTVVEGALAVRAHGLNPVRSGTNGSADVLVRDRQPGTNERVSGRHPGAGSLELELRDLDGGDGLALAAVDRAPGRLEGDARVRALLERRRPSRCRSRRAGRRPSRGRSTARCRRARCGPRRRPSGRGRSARPASSGAPAASAAGSARARSRLRPCSTRPSSSHHRRRRRRSPRRPAAARRRAQAVMSVLRMSLRLAVRRAGSRNGGGPRAGRSRHGGRDPHVQVVD